MIKITCLEIPPRVSNKSASGGGGNSRCLKTRLGAILGWRQTTYPCPDEKWFGAFYLCGFNYVGQLDVAKVSFDPGLDSVWAPSKR